MPNPYTIRLFVPDGDPTNFKIIDKMNWTGIGLEISREAWAKYKNRNEFEQAGIYILFGYQEGDDLRAPTAWEDGTGERALSGFLAGEAVGGAGDFDELRGIPGGDEERGGARRGAGDGVSVTFPGDTVERGGAGEAALAAGGASRGDAQRGRGWANYGARRGVGDY